MRKGLMWSFALPRGSSSSFPIKSFTACSTGSKGNTVRLTGVGVQGVVGLLFVLC